MLAPLGMIATCSNTGGPAGAAAGIREPPVIPKQVQRHVGHLAHLVRLILYFLTHQQVPFRHAGSSSGNAQMGTFQLCANSLLSCLDDAASPA